MFHHGGLGSLVQRCKGIDAVAASLIILVSSRTLTSGSGLANISNDKFILFLSVLLKTSQLALLSLYLGDLVSKGSRGKLRGQMI